MRPGLAVGQGSRGLHLAAGHIGSRDTEHKTESAIASTRGMPPVKFHRVTCLWQLVEELRRPMWPEQNVPEDVVVMEDKEMEGGGRTQRGSCR